jgi:ribosomal protein S27E
MDVQCINCGQVNRIQDLPQHKHHCGKCGTVLPTPQPSGDSSQAVGLIGGAALGAAIGGPAGAIVGGLLGAILGKQSKGVG